MRSFSGRRSWWPAPAGETNTAIAKRFGVRGSTVGKWRQRYLDLGIEGLHDELRPCGHGPMGTTRWLS